VAEGNLSSYREGRLNRNGKIMHNQIAYYVSPISSEMMSKLASELKLIDLQEKPKEAPVNLIVMEIGTKILDQVETCRRLSQEGANVLALVSIHHAVKYHNQLLRAGARGFLLMECSIETVRDAVLQVSKGLPYVDPEIVELLKKTWK